MATLNLMLGARPDERFHLQSGEPIPEVTGSLTFYRKVRWRNVWNVDGSAGEFSSTVINFGLKYLQWYSGTAKCDGTRTLMYRAGQLGEPYDQDRCVMTTTPKEMKAWRFRSKDAIDAVPVWTNMGGA
jgi:hypothetical protein